MVPLSGQPRQLERRHASRHLSFPQVARTQTSCMTMPIHLVGWVNCVDISFEHFPGPWLLSVSIMIHDSGFNATVTIEDENSFSVA